MPIWNLFRKSLPVYRTYRCLKYRIHPPSPLSRRCQHCQRHRSRANSRRSSGSSSNPSECPSKFWSFRASKDLQKTRCFRPEGRAELERNLIKDRVLMGISRARKQGKALGRPRVEVDPLQVAGLHARGHTRNQIAAELGVGRGTVERAFRSLPKNLTSRPTTLHGLVLPRGSRHRKGRAD